MDVHREHHPGRILFAARGDLFNDVQNEVDEVISRQPLAQIAGQKYRRLPTQIHKTFSDEVPIPTTSV